MRNLKEECKFLKSAIKFKYQLKVRNLKDAIKIQTMNFGGDCTPYGSPALKQTVYTQSAYWNVGDMSN